MGWLLRVSLWQHRPEPSVQSNEQTLCRLRRHKPRFSGGPRRPKKSNSELNANYSCKSMCLVLIQCLDSGALVVPSHNLCSHVPPSHGCRKTKCNMCVLFLLGNLAQHVQPQPCTSDCETWSALQTESPFSGQAQNQETVAWHEEDKTRLTRMYKTFQKQQVKSSRKASSKKMQRYLLHACSH